MWYNRLSEYLVKKDYKNDPICPCGFIKKSESRFAIVVVCRRYEYNRNSKRVNKNYWIFEKGVWGERFGKNQIMS